LTFHHPTTLPSVTHSPCSHLSAPLLRHTSYPFCHFFFHSTATPQIYPLSLHDALPIYRRRHPRDDRGQCPRRLGDLFPHAPPREDRKSTRLNSSHVEISYAVFCLKKKKQVQQMMNVFCVLTVIGVGTVALASVRTCVIS